MAVINGKWKLISSTNMEAFHDAIKTPQEFKAKALALMAEIEKDPTADREQQMQDLDIFDGKIQRSTIVNGEKISAMEFEFGVEQERQGPDGRTVKGSSHLVSDSKITFDFKASDFESSGSFVADGNELTLTLIGNGVTAYQKFIRCSCNKDEMTAINGRWKLVSTDNTEEYHTAIKSSEEFKEQLRQLAAARKANPDIYFEEFHIDPKAGTLSRSFFFDNEKKRDVTYKLGSENDGKTPDGTAMKITYSLAGDNKITIHEKRSDIEIDGFLEAKGNELTQSVTTQGVTSTQTYSKIV